jgi:hypothetical protein
MGVINAWGLPPYDYSISIGAEQSCALYRQLVVARYADYHSFNRGYTRTWGTR